jgi:simple sugar transport system permease protein
MAILQKGAAVAESIYNISSATSAILEGVILFTILAADFFIRYKVRFNFGKPENGEVK